jgi:hypothetical protein
MLQVRVRPMLFVVLVAVVLALFGGASAQSSVVVEPLRIVVNPTPGFGVQVRVDKDSTGRGAPIYFEGDAIRLSVTVSEEAYVYLFNVSADGSITQFFPNRLDGAANRVRAGQVLQVPPATGARYSLTVAEPFGVDKVIAVASRRPLDTSTLAAFASDFAPDAPAATECRVDCFASSDLGQDGLAQTLRIVVAPLPQADWVTDTVRFQVRRR